MGSGKVYVVHNDWIKDPVNGKMPYKVGITTEDSVEDGRFHGIGLIMPGKFVCDFAYEFDGEEYKELEKAVHEMLDKSKVNGEWFWVDKREMSGIRRMCELAGGRPIADQVAKEFAGEKIQDGEPTKVLSDIESLRKEYWSYLIKYFNQQDASLKGRRPTANHWYNVVNIRPSVHISLGFDIEDSQLWCCLVIKGIKAKEAIFKLKEEQDIIERELGTKLEWEDDEYEKYKCIYITFYRSVIIKDRDRWEEFIKWHKKYAELFYKTFSHRVKNLEL
jgi:hypothetical protein